MSILIKLHCKDELVWSRTFDRCLKQFKIIPIAEHSSLLLYIHRYTCVLVYNLYEVFNSASVLQLVTSYKHACMFHTACIIFRRACRLEALQKDNLIADMIHARMYIQIWSCISCTCFPSILTMLPN